MTRTTNAPPETPPRAPAAPRRSVRLLLSSSVVVLSSIHCGGNAAAPATNTPDPGSGASSAEVVAAVPEPTAAPSAAATADGSAAPATPPGELQVRWTALATGHGFHWLKGDLVSVVATAKAIGTSTKSRVEITIEKPLTGKGKPFVQRTATVNGVAYGPDLDVTPSGIDWSELAFSALLQVSSTGYVHASSTFDGKSWTAWTYEPGGPGAVAAEESDPAGPPCRFDLQEHVQTVSSDVTFVAAECTLGFTKGKSEVDIPPPERLFGTASAVAESEHVVWLATSGQGGRLYLWKDGAWASGALPAGVGRYSLLLDHRPGEGLVAISDQDAYGKLEIAP